MCFQWKWRFTFTVACGGKVNRDICRLRWKCSGLSSSLPPSSRKLSRSRRRRSSWRSLLSSHSLLSLPPFKIETLKAFVFIHLLFCRLHLTSLPFLDSKLECCFILRQWWTLSQQEWMFYPEFCLHIPSCQSSSPAHSILECCSNSRQWRTQTGKRQCSRSRSRRNYWKSGGRRMSPWSTMKFCRYIFFFWSSHHILNLCMFAKNYVFLGSRKQQGRHWEIQTGAASTGQRGSLFGQVSLLPHLIVDLPWSIWFSKWPRIWHGIILDPDQHSDQVHQAEPGPGPVQQHQVLLLWPAEWAGLSLQQDPWQRLETSFTLGGTVFPLAQKGLLILYHYDRCSSLVAKK